MGLVPVLAAPGICKSSSDYGAGRTQANQGSGTGTSFRQLTGRYSDGDKTRFVAGFPEKIGGWEHIPDILTPTGVARNIAEWNINSTPGWEFPSFRLSTPFSATVGSSIVIVTQVDHGHATGDYATFQGATSSVGLDYNETFPITVTSANTYTINCNATASGSNPTDGGTPVFVSFWTSAISRVIVGTEAALYEYDGTELVEIGPHRFFGSQTVATITTIAGSHLFSLANTIFATPGDQIYLFGTTNVGGISFNGYYTFVDAGGGNLIAYSPTAAISSASGSILTGTLMQDSATLNSPFTVVFGNHTVTVNHTNHGAVTGDTVTYANASSAYGIDYNTIYSITVLNLNQYTIQVAASPAGSGSDGGTHMSAYYDVSNENVQSSMQQTGVKGWTFGAYGNQMLCAPIGGTIYVYDPTINYRPYPLANAPTNVQGIIVTPERFVVALGTSVSLQQMSWADQDDYTIWTTTPTNTANTGRTLQGGSKFFCGIPIQNGVSLAFMDRATFELSYTGDNNVYATPLIANTTGIVGPYAVATSGGVAYWIGNGDFWEWNGSVKPLPTDDIREYVFNNINKQYIQKCFVTIDKTRKEVWFFYPRGEATEITNYVIYHTDQGIFSIGVLERTCWMDAGLFPYPLAFDASGVFYQQEKGVDADGSAMDSYVEFAPIDIANGDWNMDVMGFIPDFARLTGAALLTINTRQYPQNPNTPNGPYTVADDDTTPLIDFRADGKMMGYKIESDVVGGDFRLGIFRIEIQQSGARL